MYLFRCEFLAFCVCFNEECVYHTSVVTSVVLLLLVLLLLLKIVCVWWKMWRETFQFIVLNNKIQKCIHSSIQSYFHFLYSLSNFTDFDRQFDGMCSFWCVPLFSYWQQLYVSICVFGRCLVQQILSHSNCVCCDRNGRLNCSTSFIFYVCTHKLYDNIVGKVAHCDRCSYFTWVTLNR